MRVILVQGTTFDLVNRRIEEGAVDNVSSPKKINLVTYFKLFYCCKIVQYSLCTAELKPELNVILYQKDNFLNRYGSFFKNNILHFGINCNRYCTNIF